MRLKKVLKQWSLEDGLPQEWQLGCLGIDSNHDRGRNENDKDKRFQHFQMKLKPAIDASPPVTPPFYKKFSAIITSLSLPITFFLFLFSSSLSTKYFTHTHSFTHSQSFLTTHSLTSIHRQMHTHTHTLTHTQTHEQWENDFNWMGTCKQTDKLWSKLDCEHEDENCWVEKKYFQY